MKKDKGYTRIKLKSGTALTVKGGASSARDNKSRVEAFIKNAGLMKRQVTAQQFAGHAVAGIVDGVRILEPAVKSGLSDETIRAAFMAARSESKAYAD